MDFEPFVWFCRPSANGVWAQETDSSFGAYTPCAIDSVVGNVSHLVLLGLCLYRIWLIKFNPKLRRFCLRSNFYNYVLALLASCCAAEQLVRFVMRISIFNMNKEIRVAPFEMVHLGIEFISWCSMILMLLVETKIYVQEFRWYIKFGVIYVLVGDAVISNFIFSLKDHYVKSTLYFYITSIFVQVLFGLFLLFYVPNLDSYPGYTPLLDSLDDTKNDKPLGEFVCPERYANIFSWMYFDWMTPLLQQGYKKPITEKDVWKLDSWDQTETLSTKFQISWEEESRRSKPWLLRALNRSLGGRFWYGGFFKIGFVLSQLSGPVLLNRILKSLESGNPSWSLGVLCLAQYYQNVVRVGFRLRSTLVSAIFRKSLRLTHESRKHFPSGKITNMMTTDANALEQICQQLHGLWSFPFRITMAMVLLYQQLGVAALLGSLMLVLMFPIQTFIVSRTRKLSKEGLLRTDKRVGLMNEILAAMDTVKYYVWENSLKSKVQIMRDDELSWFSVIRSYSTAYQSS